MSISVILADDHRLLVEGFKIALSDFGIDVVKSFEAPDGVIDAYKKLKPDVMVLDIRFTGNMNGLELCSQIRKNDPNARIVMLSQFDQEDVIQSAYEVGAKAFIKKDDDVEFLVEAIRHAAAGENYFSPEVAQKLARMSISPSPSKILDEKELNVFRLVANGMTNPEIAEELAVSLKTISKLTVSIKNKLGISRSAEFTKLAIKYNLIKLD
ncbi:response regulator [Hahella ganghwensis]|uniref:response regulator n=1 Tax=Hahella ganghwensis TaxID=286420 RepID=UPI00037CA76B|nr:response regulator transcription factor [Hahella ganghwensis]